MNQIKSNIISKFFNSREPCTIKDLNILRSKIKVYEETILDTPPNDDGADIRIPNFLMVEYRLLKSLEEALSKSITKCKTKKIK